MNLVRTFDRVLTAIVNGLLVTAFAVMLGLAALQVFLRFFLHTGVLWGDVAARNLVIWVGFFGAFLAARENKHFRIDVLTRLIPHRLQSWLAALTELFAAVIAYFLLRASITFVNVGIDPEAVLFLGIPQTAIAIIVPIGFGLLVIQFLLRASESISAAIQNKPAEGDA